MDKLAKIKKELKRLREETSIGLSDHDNGVEQGRMEIINALSVFLDSLQKESVSEELEEEITRVWNNTSFEPKHWLEFERIAHHFVNWQKEQMIKDAKSGIGNYDNYIKFEDGTWIGLDPSMQQKPAFNVNEGDKVKVLVVKED